MPGRYPKTAQNPRTREGARPEDQPDPATRIAKPRAENRSETGPAEGRREHGSPAVSDVEATALGNKELTNEEFAEREKFLANDDR
jgi:hypothetical protein